MRSLARTVGRSDGSLECLVSVACDWKFALPLVLVASSRENASTYDVPLILQKISCNTGFLPFRKADGF